MKGEEIVVMSVALGVLRNRASVGDASGPVAWSTVAPAANGEGGALDQIGTKIRFGRNETIFSEGDEVTHSYKVVSGVIRLCKHMADGRRQIADFVQPGDFCGLMSTGEYRFTAEAVGEVVVVAYPQRQVESLGDKVPGVRKWMMGFLTQSLMGMQDHLVMLGRQTAKERVASFLLMLAERSGADVGDTIDLPMNRQDIADYLGLTIETVCRVLSDLKRSAVIDLPSLHEAALADLDALHDIADGE
jgi:CRP-like cAMP-binding protein